MSECESMTRLHDQPGAQAESTQRWASPVTSQQLKPRPEPGRPLFLLLGKDTDRLRRLGENLSQLHEIAEPTDTERVLSTAPTLIVFDAATPGCSGEACWIASGRPSRETAAAPGSASSSSRESSQRTATASGSRAPRAAAARSTSRFRLASRPLPRDDIVGSRLSAARWPT